MSETEGSMRLWLVGLVLLVGHAFGGAEEASWRQWRSAGVPASLHAVFGLEAGSSAAGRSAAVAALPATLTDEEAGWLQAFLCACRPKERWAVLAPERTPPQT